MYSLSDKHPTEWKVMNKKLPSTLNVFGFVVVEGRYGIIVGGAPASGERSSCIYVYDSLNEEWIDVKQVICMNNFHKYVKYIQI